MVETVDTYAHGATPAARIRRRNAAREALISALVSVEVARDFDAFVLAVMVVQHLSVLVGQRGIEEAIAWLHEASR
jgi:hypothetical protein